MSNLQFEKITGYVQNVRDRYKNEMKKAVKELLDCVSDINRQIEDGADYIGTSTDLVKLRVEKIDKIQSQMSAMDSVLRAKEMIETNFPTKHKVYWYGYRLRGFSIGCQPKGFIKTDSEYGRFGAVAYDRELTEQEMSEYELDFIQVEER